MDFFDKIKRTLFGDKEAEQSTRQGQIEASQAQRPDNGSHALEGEDAQHYVAALKAQREDKDRHFRNDFYSPIPYNERGRFTGLNYFEPDLAYRYTLTLQKAQPEPITFQTSTGAEQHYRRIGTVQFEVEGEDAELAIYRSGEGHLFLPFRDATSGKESYAAGRYLEPLDLGEERIMLDFNLAYNPYCAYSPDFSCPLPPLENWLKLPIRAGEKKYNEDEYQR